MFGTNPFFFLMMKMIEVAVGNRHPKTVTGNQQKMAESTTTTTTTTSQFSQTRGKRRRRPLTLPKLKDLLTPPPPTTTTTTASLLSFDRRRRRSCRNWHRHCTNRTKHNSFHRYLVAVGYVITVLFGILLRFLQNGNNSSPSSSSRDVVTTMMTMTTTTTTTMMVLGLASQLPQSSKKFGRRHICLFEDYKHVQGPYFNALLDQLIEQTMTTNDSTLVSRNGDEGDEEGDDESSNDHGKKKSLVLCTTRSDLQYEEQIEEDENDGSFPDYKKSTPLDVMLDDLRSCMQLDYTDVLIMDDFNPVSLSERLQLSQSRPSSFSSSSDEGSRSQMIDPTIIWVRGRNAFRTRHFLRTSGLDMWIRQRCCGGMTARRGGDSNMHCVPLYVGEGAGAVVAGATMDIAYVKGDDPRESPELQVNGLALFGDRRSVAFGLDTTALEDNHRTQSLMEKAAIELCNNDQVYVWSQDFTIDMDDSDEVIATKFVMTPGRRGMIEQFTNPDPLPILIDDTNSLDEGVPCVGEPAIDPSRTMQRVGDSEWVEEYLD